MTSILDNFPHECTTAKRVRVKEAEGLGVATDTYETIGTSVSCWEQTASSSDQKVFSKKGFTDVRKVYFAADPGLTERSVVIITSRSGTAVASASQEVLDVISNPKPDSSVGLAVLWKVMVSSDSGSKYNASDVSIV